MEATRSSETLVSHHITTRRGNAEDHDLKVHQRIRNSPQFDSILSQLYSVHIFLFIPARSIAALSSDTSLVHPVVSFITVILDHKLLIYSMVQDIIWKAECYSAR
jgi:hypothetical protein